MLRDLLGRVRVVLRNGVAFGGELVQADADTITVVDRETHWVPVDGDSRRMQKWHRDVRHIIQRSEVAVLTRVLDEQYEEKGR